MLFDTFCSKIKIISLLLCLAIIFSACDSLDEQTGSLGDDLTASQGDAADLGDDEKTFGEALEDTGAYDGYFEGASNDVIVTCVSGTDNAYKFNGNTLTFTAISKESVYSVSGKLKGNIVIDIGDDFKFELELNGISIVSDLEAPIVVLSGDEVSIQAKKDTQNYIYDTRSEVDRDDDASYSSAINSKVDLEISGKGELTVVSENNNGIHSKDDLQVKNLKLFVACADNSLKGNDSVEIENCQTTLIASVGDCIKTSNSDVSDKGNQRGTISIYGGVHTLYAACDGIDAAYDVNVDGEATQLSIFTDKYSNYSKEVVSTSSDSNYIRFTSDKYYYSVKYYNSETDYAWVNADYHSTVAGSRNNYFYYSYPKNDNYKKQQFFIYERDDQRGQDEEFLVKSDFLTPNSGCDTIALSQSYNGISYEWTNYTTKIQDNGFGGRPGGPGGGGPGGGGPGGGGPGGFGEGNSDKGDHSTKGIKAANEIIINSGAINVKSYDDAIHANNDGALENGKSPLGNVTINGGTITVYSNDDGLHADGILLVKSGTVAVTNAYEGLEGSQVEILGGYVSVISKDDGINATVSTGTAIAIKGGEVYIYCTGDGIDSNSKTSGQGIVFSGGNVVVISNSGMNSAIDSEKGYSYTGGSVVAVMPRGGMSSEATHCDNFSSIGSTKQISLNSGEYLVAVIGNVTATIKMPISLNAYVIVLGDNSPSINSESSVNDTLDNNGVSWK